MTDTLTRHPYSETDGYRDIVYSGQRSSKQLG
jgi:hypothetical protein